MAFGRSTSEQNSNLVFLTPKAKIAGKEVTPSFHARKKIDGTYQEIKAESEFSGTLVKIEHKLATPPAPAQPFDLIVYTVDDGENRFVCEFTFKHSTRSLFNRTMGLQDFDNIEIGYFRNKDGFETLALKQNGAPVKAKFAKGEFPEVTIITNPKTGKEVSKDYDEINTFFKDEMIAFGKRLQGAAPTAPVIDKKEDAGDYKDVSQEDLEEAPFWGK